MPARQRTTEVERKATPSPQTPAAELWEAWRMAQAGSELALQTWYAASYGQKARTYAAYSAALAREGQAAEALALAGVDGVVAAA